MATFDFSEATIGNDTRTLEVRNPVDDTVIATMEVYNIDADKPRRLQRKYEKQLVKRPRGAKVDLEELEENALDVLASCVVGWNGVAWKGQELTFTPENVKMILGIKWVREQVERFVNDVAGFLDHLQPTLETPVTNDSSSTTEPVTEGH